MRKDVGAIMPDCLYRLSVSALSVIGALILLASSALADPPKTEAERNAVLDTIQWHEGGVFHLERSKATIRVPNRFAVALDSDVRNFYEVVNGVSAPKNLEAMIVDTKTKILVLYAPVQASMRGIVRRLMTPTFQIVPVPIRIARQFARAK